MQLAILIVASTVLLVQLVMLGTLWATIKKGRSFFYKAKRLFS